MDAIQGKHFSITDPEGVKTVIYEVYTTKKEFLNEYPKFTVERLEHTEEIKDGIKQSAQKLEDAAKKELQEIKSEITANLPGKRIGNKFKKIFFLIIAPLGAITGAAVKFKDKILIFLKGLKNENNSNSGTEQK